LRNDFVTRRPTQAAWLLPGWLPLPSFRTRDRAHLKLKEIFKGVIAERRANKDLDKSDMLATFMNTPYRTVCLTRTEHGCWCPCLWRVQSITITFRVFVEA
jgi:sterol 14-demethylase